MLSRAQITEQAALLSRQKYELSVVADWRYRQFFSFLQISPSYRQAHLIAVGELDRAAQPLPSDFGLVETTYRAFGDVSRTYFWDWWLSKAQYQFGVSAAPKAKALLRVDMRQPVTEEMIAATHGELDEFVLVDRPAQGSLATLVLAIPLQNDRKALLKQVSHLIDAAYGKEREQQGIAPYHMVRNKMREQTLIMAMRVLRARAARPKDKLFVIGNLTNVSPAHWSDAKLKRDKVEANKRENMEILTSRHLHRAYLIAENAARGKFPSLEPLPPDTARPSFDYVQLNRQLKSYIKWAEGEVATLEARKQRRTGL